MKKWGKWLKIKREEGGNNSQFTIRCCSCGTMWVGAGDTDKVIENKPMKVGKNEIVRMSVNGGTGMYVIRLLKDGKNIEAFKIEKK